jgi:hypothetical protein
VTNDPLSAVENPFRRPSLTSLLVQDHQCNWNLMERGRRGMEQHKVPYIFSVSFSIGSLTSVLFLTRIYFDSPVACVKRSWLYM